MHAPLATIAQDAGPLWLSEFEAFSTTHGVVFACAVGAMAGASMLGRRWLAQGEAKKEWRFRVAWSLFIIVFQAFGVAWYAWPSNFDWARSLPLHICDLVVWLAPLALLTQWRPARTVLYFWGVGLSTQAFFTPVLQDGAASPEFWVFWVGHTQIVGSAIYDAAALGYRPRLRDVAIAMGITLGYLALITPFNLAFDWNYGYVGAVEPETPTIIDRLGPWPLRLLPMFGLTLLAFLLAWAPWVIGARIVGGRPATSPLGGEVGERSEPGEGS
ncbi:MAG: TIGR02206 family membrane protein [Phycisphaerales bacterium]